MPETNTKAPEIILQNQNGETVRLNDFLGKKLILYFYSRDNTAGCSRQAAAFAEAYEELKSMNAEVIGISKDSIASHAKFARKYNLPFALLSDPELQAIQSYDVWKEKKLYGKTSMGVVRSAFLIDENGNLEKAWLKVKPDTNAQEVLNYLKSSQ